jgi:hypothetical protein
MPPLGYYGEVVRGIDEYGDFEVLFPNYLWREVMQSNADSNTWEIPARWLLKINPEEIKKQQTEFLELRA